MGLIASLCVILFLAFQFTNVENQSQRNVEAVTQESDIDQMNNINWKEVDLHRYSIPVEIGENGFSNTITDNSKTIKLEGGKKEVRLYYKECIPKEPRKGVLWLLHGAAFTSKTWQDSIPTIQTICELGYRVVAIDIPGFGKTPDCNRCDRVDFMRSVLDNIIGNSIKPVIVSPSMSGGWSLPFIEKNQDLIRGFVPVAPVQTSNYKDFFAQKMKVPTMIVYGERDTGLGTGSYNDLKNIQTSTKPQILKEAKHPAYLDQPKEWHTLLYNFLKLLE